MEGPGTRSDHKVAEYQQRGLIHSQAVVRPDGPAGSYSLPPPGPPPNSWQTPSGSRPPAPHRQTGGQRQRPLLRFGKQIDTRIIRPPAFQAGPRSPRARSPDTSPSTPPRAPKPRRAPSTTS
ncbi:replication initiator [Streptomyces sp. NPDC003077]|uniref:replication initiator n=1 Tax=Streptomyces sp. NPDC003077 TaxID=3154443 RepID=UPI00339EF6B8